MGTLKNISVFMTKSFRILLTIENVLPKFVEKIETHTFSITFFPENLTLWK
jgi:hypothetical protein